MLAGCALAPQSWPWWLSGFVANHALLAAGGLWPRSSLLGPNITRLPDAAAQAGLVALSFDDGPDPEVTPRVLEWLERKRARGSFFCIGEKLRRHEPMAREIIAAGHSLENHTQSHSHRFACLGPAGFRREIGLAQQTVRTIAGEVPRFFRAPAGLRNPFLQPILDEYGLRLTSWTRRGYDTMRPDPEPVYRRLTRDLAAGDILLLHDGHAARARSGRPVVLEVLPRLLERIESLGLRAVSLREGFAVEPASGACGPSR